MNKELIEAKAREKYGSMAKFALAMDVSSTSLSEYVREMRPAPKPIIKLMSLMLEIPEDKLMETPKSSSTETVPSASSIIQTEEIKTEIKALDDEIRALRNDLSTMAKMLIEINKTTHETSAQANLNADELTAIFSKVGEINGNVTKIYARYKKG